MLFELTNVTKTYGRVTALDNLSVKVPAGAIGLLGPNGSGKTTMIRTLLGLIKIDRGAGQILDLDIRRQQHDIRRLVGFAPENECLFPGVVGIESVAYAGELVGMARKDALQRAHEVLDYVGLGEARYRRVETYSTGMKQRIKLASAIVHDPKLVILDEPTNGMDPAGREEVLLLARDLAHNKGMSLIFSSHLLPDVEYVCDHVVVLGNGRLLAEGSIQEMKRKQQQDEDQLADDAITVPAAALPVEMVDERGGKGTKRKPAGTQYEVRPKADPELLADHLEKAGCAVRLRSDDLLLVRVPPGRNLSLIWEVARAGKMQIRHLRPRRASLEDVFMKAVEE